MNERIKELIKQAADQTSAAFSSSNFRQSEWESDFREKFAELIIHECAGIALEQKKWVEDMKVHNPHDEHWNKARIQQSQRIVDKILEHFEVK